MSGHEGLAQNVELVRTVREAVGGDHDLMFGCWQSMDVTYVEALADRIGIPLAGAEHENTRWGFKRFIDAGALDVFQPDIYWCGGLSFSVTQSPIHTPYQEYLVKWNSIHQYFLRDPVDRWTA